MKANYLRTKRKRTWGAEPGLQPEYVPESEADQARRQMRDWLRDDVTEWDMELYRSNGDFDD